jgi:hypothetical protein
LGAWLTWMCLTTKLPVSRPLASALDSAFLRRPRRNSADLTGQRARVTPNCLPVAEIVSNALQLPFVPNSLWSGKPHSPVPPIPTPKKKTKQARPSRKRTPWMSNRTLRGAADAAAVASHGDGLLLLKDVLEELLGTRELPAVDSLGSLAGVLERNTKVGAARAGGLRRGDLLGSVPNL